MPDLLSHVLFVYAALQFVALRHDLDPHEVTAGLLGAILPDASKVSLLIGDNWIESPLGRPVDFLGWHTVTGVVLSVMILSLLTGREHRPRVTAFLVAGAASHLGLDLLLRTAAGVTPYALFWPVSSFRPPTLGWYLSGDPHVLGLALVAALSTHVVARWR